MKWKGKINFDARPQYATDGLITSAEVDTISGSLQINIDGKSDIAHFHDDRYYTESEVDDLITTVSGKLDDHNEMNNLDYVSSGHIGFASSDTLSMASAVELTIVSGTVTCTQTLHRIDTEGDIATDDLDTIIGGTDGDIIIVRAENGTRTVVLKDGTGNLKLGGRDLELIDTNMAVMLFYSGVLDQWLLIGDGGGSATAAVSDDAFSSAWDGGTAVAPSRNAVYDIMVTKSDLSHLHDDRYYTESEVDTISGALNTKIDGKSDTDHIHDSRYYTETELNEGQLDNRYYTESETDTISGSLQTNIDGKSDIAHFHDDRYYIESEVDTISGSLSSEIDSDISTHTSNSDAHHNESHNVASHSDTTATGDNLNELVGGGDTILHKHDTLYYTESEVDTISGSLNTSKSDVGHSHTESDITDLDKYTEAEINTISGSLQTAIDGKSDIGHIHDSRYYTESEVDTISGSLNTKLDTHKSADDHTNYLLIDGTRAMTDNLDMDSYSINNINVTNLKAISCTVHNATGSTLTAGTCVYPNGVSGGVVTVAKCDVTDKDKMPCLGIISVNIANGTADKAVTRGIKSMDTSGFSGSVYDRVYVQADGSIDTTEPTSGSVQRIGILTVKDVSGQIYIHIRGRKSIVAAANEHPEMRMGNDAGHKKIVFRDYNNDEIAALDDSGNVTLSGTVDTVDIATFKSDFDSHDHDNRYYTESEVDTISGSLQTDIDTKADKGANADITSTTALTQITRATGGAFDIAIGGAVGDDFTVDTDKFVVEGDTSNIGIGTTTPGSILQIDKSDSTVYTSSMSGANAYMSYPQELEIKNTANGVDNSFTGLFFYAGDVTKGVSISSARISAIKSGVAHTDLAFGTRAGGIMEERVRIDSTGKVGIGTTSPGGKLCVNGGLTVGSDTDAGDNNLRVEGNIVSDSDLDNVTLANGIEGQTKYIACIAEGNAADTWKITPTSMVGGTQITFAGIGEGCTLKMYSAGWIIVGNNGGTIS
jgi:hypothetical protein